MLVAVQGHDELAAIDPATLAVTRRVRLPGCEHSHGLSLDPGERLGFVACDANAALLTLDLSTWQTAGTNPVGQEPDVLAYDQTAHRLYVAAESGWVTVLDERDRRLNVVGSDHLADGAHVVAVDDTTHHSFYPLPAGARPPSAPGGSTHCLEALRCRPRFTYCCCARAACSSEAFTTCTWSLICR